VVVVTSADIGAALLIRQGLSPEPPWHSVHEAVTKIGAVQIDTIAAVARSHHLILRHRSRNYHPEHLWATLRERKLFEYYVHGNSFVPIEDFPYVRHCMQRFSTHWYKWLRGTIPKYQQLMEAILKRVKEEGPLTSRDFKDPKHRARGWWDWKPAKNALELLWWMGRIIVVDRVGFQRVYDLTENVVPSEHLDRTVNLEEVWRHYLRRTVDCLVIATSSDIRDYFNFHIYSLDKKQSEKKTLEEKTRILLGEDAIVEIEVEDSDIPHYALSDNTALVEKACKDSISKDHALFLSPFDNIVWDRKRVQRLFKTDVKLEAYLPPEKREFGYYVMPIIWSGRIVGRLDPKVDRRTSTLILANLELDLKEEEQRDACDAIRGELHRFKSFHNCEHLRVERTKPARLKREF